MATPRSGTTSHAAETVRRGPKVKSLTARRRTDLYGLKVALTLRPDEPPAGPWRVESLVWLVDLLLRTAGAPDGRPPVVAVDGRGASGKSTLAERLRLSVPGAQVVHTDDIAWAHSRFGWDDVMIGGVLEPLHRGESVHYRPPAWGLHGREGHVDVAAAAPLVIVEGVGASRRELTNLIDAAVWVQSDWVEAERRGLVRDGGDAEAMKNWHAWMSEELPFIAADRPWERATILASSTPHLDHDPVKEVVVAPPMKAGSRPPPR